VIDVLFVIASAIAIASSWLVVTRRNPVYGAAWMMAALFSLAVVFLLLESSFLAVIQVLLYAGAILVLFLFVIMLLNPAPEELLQDRSPLIERAAAAILAATLLIVVVGALAAGGVHDVPAFTAEGAAAVVPADFGTTPYFGRTIYDRYLLAFEAISLLVMAAIAGAVLLAKRQLGEEEPAAPRGKPAGAEGAKKEPRRELEGMVH
jgi:NADH-quinone oxidoreductase subunit J